MGTDEMLNKSFAQLQRAKERGLSLSFDGKFWTLKEHGEPALLTQATWLARELYTKLRDA